MLILTTQCFPPRRGGIETLIHALAEALIEQKIPVEVWADEERGVDCASFDRQLHYKVRRYGGLKPWRRQRKAVALASALEARHCTAVIADTWKSVEHLNIQTTAPILCLAHGTELATDISHRKSQRIRAALAKATTIIANSEFTANLAQTFVTRNKIKVIYPGITPRPVPSDSNVDNHSDVNRKRGRTIISVARLEPRKGIDRVIAVLPRLLESHPVLRYIVIGNGTQKQSLEKQVQELGLQAHVSFMGAVSDDERDACLARSDLFVLPGRADGADIEGFGISFIEAAWFGLPAVASRVGGAHEAVLHEFSGLVCDDLDENGVFNAIHRLFCDDELRALLSENARCRARSLIWSKVIQEYLPLLESAKV